MISELYGEREASLVYDVHTAAPVGTQRTAEHFRLDDAGITSIMLIFDGTPWQAMVEMMGQAPARGRYVEANTLKRRPVVLATRRPPPDPAAAAVQSLQRFLS